ncbi:invasion protein IalB [Roseiarcus fermentans]|uniref:Invasion protein IalB n=1 Tax=Roseiarcus fermentans TaxID=1473586 RepID=A0A366FX91_9HYPH|nr:invasion associated locus B family protein [Roseiarcus fermentans]RBP18355.1 invasion protein IalB [Roseiarcus fermentans]
MHSTPGFLAAICGVIPFLAVGSLSLAQTVQPPAPSVTPEAPRASEAEPTSTSARYGDWIMRCQRLGDGVDAERVCEAAQLIHAQDQQYPVAEVAIGRLKKTDPLHLTIALPVNIAFPTPPRLSLNGKDVDGLLFVWLKCIPGGCYANAPLTEDVLRRWKDETGGRRILWTDGSGRESAVELSFQGLGPALAALNRAIPGALVTAKKP